MKNISVLGVFVAALAVCAQAIATPNYVYDYTYDGTTLTTNQSAAGNQLAVGQVVQLTLHAAGDDYWLALTGADIWAPIGMGESGIRQGSLSWMYLLDGVTVDSGSYANQPSEYVHIANFMPTTGNINFDELVWDFTLISTDSALNTLQGALNSPNPFRDAGIPNDQPTYVHVNSSIPEPASLALLGIGLAGLGVMRRRKSIQS